MANVIKHKRGTSDPTASDLVVGEVAIRTDVGKLFTKMDNGSVAEIAGGGSDIIINTLSSSSATGGGSATFNGSAYRFTLSQPPSVSAQQLLVSIAGVIQKPIAGTGQPSEGFSINGNDIILAAAPATGTDFFILTFKSLGVSEPADNTVTSAKIVDGAIVNADINASAAIARTKLANVDLVDDSSPQLGGNLDSNTRDIHLNNSGDVALRWQLSGTNKWSIFHNTAGSTNHLEIFDNNGSGTAAKFLTNGAVELYHDNSKKLETTTLGVSITGAITGTGDLTIDTNTLFVDVSANAVGIGTTSPSQKLQIAGGSGDACVSLLRTNAASNNNAWGHVFFENSSDAILASISGRRESAADDAYMQFSTQTTGGSITERMRIDSSGKVLIGTTTEGHEEGDDLTIATSGVTGMTIRSGTSSAGNIFFSDATSGSAERQGIIRYDHSDDAMKFNVNNAERMRIDSSGNLGLNTSPANVLDVRGSAHAKVLVGTTGTSHATGLQISHAIGDGALQEWQLQTDASADGNLIVRNATSGTATMFFDADNNNVGIGTTIPTSFDSSADDLVISTSGNTGITINSGSAGSTSEGNLVFAEGTAGNQDKFRGAIQYKHGEDRFSFYTNAAERVRIDASGYVTKPNTPAFLAYHHSYDLTYTSGDTLAYMHEMFDIGNNYNTSNYTFTAPIAGRYLFSANANAYYDSTLSGIPRAYWQINGSNVANAIHLRGSDNSNTGGNADGLEQRSQTVIFNLSANDTVKMVVGVNRWDLFGANSFCGYLLG